MDNGFLYKYRSWGNEFHRNALLKNQLFFSAPRDMNDPFDFRIPSDYSLLDTDAKKVAFIVKNYDNLSPVQKERFGPLDIFGPKALHMFKTNPDFVQNYFETAESARTDDHFGVLCFSFVWDNVLMWSHYADFHRGFCLGFEKQKFIDAGIGGSGPVHYDEFPKIDPLTTDVIKESVMKSHYKAHDWQYEEEFRITLIDYPDKLFSAKRLYIFPNEFLKEIILGINIAPVDKDEILKMANERRLPVFQIQKNRLSFKLSRVLVN